MYHSISKAYRIISDGEKAVGAVLHIDNEKKHGHLDLLFVSPDVHSKGIGYAAWCEVEKMYPEIKVWETVTPYFEKRNIHFYVNRCGFHIVEFFSAFHHDTNSPNGDDDAIDEMFRFEKNMF